MVVATTQSVDPPALLSADDAARYLAISRATFYRYVAPRLRPVRVGRATRFAKRDLDALIEQLRAENDDA